MGGAAAWPLVSHAQPSSAPIVGILASRSSQDSTNVLLVFREALAKAGYAEGQSVTIEYRWAQGRYDRLPALAAELIEHKVAVIAAFGPPAALAAKATSATIPVVFVTGGDPVALGLVASLSQPGGNVTGVTQLNQGIAPKRLELLHELLPTARVIGRLVNPASSASAARQSNDVLPAAANLGLELHIVNASAARDFDAAFAKLSELGAGGLVIDSDSFFTAQQQQLAYWLSATQYRRSTKPAISSQQAA
jgi:putative ABC transport system substrate-binding protein